MVIIRERIAASHIWSCNSTGKIKNFGNAGASTLPVDELFAVKVVFVEVAFELASRIFVLLFPIVELR
jgi:hypothetical protein